MQGNALESQRYPDALATAIARWKYQSMIKLTSDSSLPPHAVHRPHPCTIWAARQLASPPQPMSLLPPPPAPASQVQPADLNQSDVHDRAAAAAVGTSNAPGDAGAAPAAPAALALPAAFDTADAATRKRKSNHPPAVKLELAVGDVLVGTPQAVGTAPDPSDYEIGLICQHLPSDSMPYQVQWAYRDVDDDKFPLVIKPKVIGQTTRPRSMRERVIKIGHVADLYRVGVTPSIEGVDVSKLPVVATPTQEQPQTIAFTDQDVKKLVSTCRSQWLRIS